MTMIQPRDPTRTLAFLHMPKTSGMAVSQALAAVCGPRQWIHGFDHVLFGAFTGFDTIAPIQRAAIHAKPETIPGDMDLISGHLALSSLTARYPMAQVVTFLREPITRLLSLWLYLRAFTAEELRIWGDWALHLQPARGPLGAFLAHDSLASIIDNVYIRMLLWPHPLIAIDGFIDPRHDTELLREARCRLASMAYADVIENPAFIVDLQAWLKTTFRYVPTNVARPPPDTLKGRLHTELTSAAFDLLEMRGRLDLQLWTYLARQCANAERLKARTLMLTGARYAALMAN
jgi:hypothetical protein